MWNLQSTMAPQSALYPAHDHCITVDDNGNGETTVDFGHKHTVQNRQIWPDARDRHTHNYAVDASGTAAKCNRAPCNCGRGAG